MEIVHHKDQFNISNIDDYTVDNDTINTGKHGSLLPNTVRCIISGPSNCGKTNVVFNLITNPKGLRFNNLYLFFKVTTSAKVSIVGENHIEGVRC